MLSPFPTTGFFQVAIQKPLKSLEAEAQVLLLGAKLAVALNIQEATLFTDNQILADAIRVGSPRTHPWYWSLRPLIYELLSITQSRRLQVRKIRRDYRL